INEITSQQELDRAFNLLLREGKTRMSLRHERFKERNISPSTVPRRITSIEDLPPSLPWELQIALEPLVANNNTEMINAQLAAFHRTITLTERSEHAVFHQKCFKDLGKAINPRTNIPPPESILPAYIERYTVGEGDLEPTPSPLPTKFAIQSIRVIDTKRSMSGIN
ncbi:hypothetical protein ADUPG1_005479, partial [Aduncisulcus paluster]